MEPVSYRLLPPETGETSALAYVQSLTLDHRDRALERPYLVMNFVASLDGHATVEGQSRKLSGSADRDLFRALRERADAVLVGTRTLEAEQYTRMLRQPDRRQRRVAAGRPPEPLTVTVSRSGRVPRDIPLFTDAPDRVLVFQGPDVTLTDTLKQLWHDHDVRLLLCEGGPTLFGALLRERLVDELFLTLAATVVGGTSGPAVVSGPPLEEPASLVLAGALEHAGTLFLRYRLET